MNYRIHFISLVRVIIAVLFAGISAGGCGTSPYPYSGDHNCPAPIIGRKDDYGRSDACCTLSPCCPNPVLDHYAFIPGWHDEDGNPPKDKTPGAQGVLWDPCCRVEECPGVNVNLPPDAGNTSGAGADPQSSLCTGQCVNVPNEGWFGPVLLWHGPAGQAPPCPETAPYDGYHGFADLDAPPVSCVVGECSCKPPSGECGPPSYLTASTSACGSAGILTPFDGPPNWDGSCTAQDAIPGGAQCNGKPCVKSLTSGPLTLTETGCTPYVDVPKILPAPEPTWRTSAIACQVSDYPPCSPTQVCAPHTPPGFSTCIFAWGEDHECPEPYKEGHVFYDDYIDNRACTGCTCDSPVGSYCTALLSLYKDNACTDLGLPPYQIASTDQGCFDILPAGLALGSKTITKSTYMPGSCQPKGGEVTGELTRVGAATLCCLQS